MNLGLDLFWHAFLDLNEDRAAGVGLQPIAWSSVVGYCVAYGIEGDLAEDVIHHVRALDRAFLDYHREKAEREQRAKEQQQRTRAKQRRGR